MRWAEIVSEAPGRRVALAEKSVDNAQSKIWVCNAPILYKPGPQKTLKKAFAAVSSVFGSSRNSRDLAEDVSTDDNKIIVEDAAWNVCGLTSTNNLRQSAFSGIRSLCQDHALLLPTKVQAVYPPIHDASVALRCSDGDRSLLHEYEKGLAVKKRELAWLSKTS